MMSNNVNIHTGVIGTIMYVKESCHVYFNLHNTNELNKKGKCSLALENLQIKPLFLLR